MHKIRIKKARQKVKEVGTVKPREKILSEQPARPVAAPEPAPKRKINPMPVLEAIPAARARDIVPLIRPTPPEPAPETRRDPRELEPRIRETEPAMRTPAPAEERPYAAAGETRAYTPSAAGAYRTATTAPYTAAPGQAGTASQNPANPEYRAGTATEPLVPERTRPLPILQPAGREDAEMRRRPWEHEEPRLAAARDRYESRQYESGERHHDGTRVKRKKPWEL